MSLYDGLEISQEKDSSSLTASQISGWSSNLQFMKTQLQLKKASQGKPPPKSRSLTSSGPGTLTLANLTGGLDPKSNFLDEYDPFRPNEYNDVKEKLKVKEEEERRERRQRERESDRDRHRDRDKDRDRDRRRDRDDDDRRPGRRDREPDRDRDRRRRRRDSDEEDDRGKGPRSGAAIAPPPSLSIAAPDPDEIEKKVGAGTGGFSTGNAVASNIMAKYGWKEGQGLGKDEQGLSTCLQVEKTSKRGGKIINKDKIVQEQETKEQPQSDTNAVLLRNISKVVMLTNMVGPGEVDDELQPEVEEECQTKYGEVAKVIIFEMPGVPEEEAVRIFVEFRRNESAVKALIDLNGRFFGGRQVSAKFYNLDKFRRFELGE
eukprot:gene2001-17556_t